HAPHTELYTLSLHDALPISANGSVPVYQINREQWSTCLGEIEQQIRHENVRRLEEECVPIYEKCLTQAGVTVNLEEIVEEIRQRSEEHTSELQSQSNLVCRL